MANVFVEARPKSRPEGSPINDYLVETQGDQVLGTFPSQAAAIAWAKSNGHASRPAKILDELVCGMGSAALRSTYHIGGMGFLVLH
jgi:hypothetical protein